MRSLHLGLLAGLTLAGAASAQELSVTMNAITAEGIGEPVGPHDRLDAGRCHLHRRVTWAPGGEHGFHVHQNGDCAPGPDDTGKVVAGGAAGKHWDPQATNAHRGPEGDGHLGDVPSIVANPDGTATSPPRHRGSPTSRSSAARH